SARHERGRPPRRRHPTGRDRHHRSAADLRHPRAAGEMSMRYVHLVHFDTAAFSALPDAARQEIDRRALAKNAELEARGKLFLAEAIQSGENAVLVRVRDGAISVT